MNLHREHHFETEICGHLVAHDWLHAEGDAALFDRADGLFMPDLLAWVETTQPESWQRLKKTHGAAWNCWGVHRQTARTCGQGNGPCWVAQLPSSERFSGVSGANQTTPSTARTRSSGVTLGRLQPCMSNPNSSCKELAAQALASLHAGAGCGQ
ncbi:hypothetical protein [Roseateles sp.]|uniref:hypothetical protein n=1 Tax=Roseateles sp. TaxID=1971397 RepID=UPI0025E86280|nr:hypothetical protein [Roseateles sp.]